MPIHSPVIVDFLSPDFNSHSFISLFQNARVIHIKNVSRHQPLSSFLKHHPVPIHVKKIIYTCHEKILNPETCLRELMQWIRAYPHSLELQMNLNLPYTLFNWTKIFYDTPKNVIGLYFKSIPKQYSLTPLNLQFFHPLPRHLHSLSLSHLHLGERLIPMLSFLPSSLQSLALDYNDIEDFSSARALQLFSSLPSTLKILQIEQQAVFKHLPILCQSISTNLVHLKISHAQSLIENINQRLSLLSQLPVQIQYVSLDHHLLLRAPYYLDKSKISSYSHHLYIDLLHTPLFEFHSFIPTVPRTVHHLYLHVADDDYQYLLPTQIKRYIFRHYSTLLTVTINEQEFHLNKIRQELELQYSKVFIALNNFDDKKINELLITTHKLNPRMELNISILEFLEDTLSLYEKPTKKMRAYYLKKAEQLPGHGSHIWQIVGGFMMMIGIMILISNLSLFILQSLINLSFQVELVGLMVSLAGYIIFQVASPQELANAALQCGRSLPCLS